MSKISKAHDLIDSAIAAIKQELESMPLPEVGPRSKKQLEEFLATLTSMRKKISGDEPLNTNEEVYGHGMGRVIVDSWPDYNQLGNIIIAAEQGYVDAICSLAKSKGK